MIPFRVWLRRLQRPFRKRAVRVPERRRVGAKPDTGLVPLHPGDLIADRFEIERVLGAGGFAVVYLVLDRASRQHYAMKTLRDEIGAEEESLSLFRKEARIWINLEPHPNIVRAHFISEHQKRLFIGMEYLPKNPDGFNSLDGYLHGTPPDFEQSVRWMIQFCYGMEFARAHGVRCHRDVKPANIMVDGSGKVKITDFGFAEVIDSTRSDAIAGRRRSVEATGFGTPVYMPPEQFLNASRCDERSDIYSLGIIMFQMAARGRLPFFPTGSESQHDRAEIWRGMHRLHAEAPIPRLASPLFPIILRCLEKEPSRRYQVFRDLRMDLDAILWAKTGRTERPPAMKFSDAWEIYNRALSLANLGDTEGAIVLYERTLERDPQFADAWNNKGVCLRKIGRMEEAVECFRQAAEIAPDLAAALRNVGNTLRTLGQDPEAIAWLSRALKVDPLNESAWLNKGLAEEHIGRRGDAAESYRAFLALPPTTLVAYEEHARKFVEEFEHHHGGSHPVT